MLKYGQLGREFKGEQQAKAIRVQAQKSAAVGVAERQGQCCGSTQSQQNM